LKLVREGRDRLTETEWEIEREREKEREEIERKKETDRQDRGIKYKPNNSSSAVTGRVKNILHLLGGEIYDPEQLETVFQTCDCVEQIIVIG